ncbi:hypothetical protein Tco_1483910 [Tanacetum coccineum]
MLLNVDQLQKQLDKDEFQEDGSMTAFWVVNNQFQKFIDSKFTLDYDSQMTDTYFVEYTGIEVNTSRDYTTPTPTQESKIDTGKALMLILVDNINIRTELNMQYDNKHARNDTDADDADIRPIYDEEPMAEGQAGQILNETSNKAKIEKEIDVLETMNIELDIVGYITSKTTEQTTSLLANNAELKAQIQEKVFAIAALKNDLRNVKRQ